MNGYMNDQKFYYYLLVLKWKVFGLGIRFLLLCGLLGLVGCWIRGELWVCLRGGRLLFICRFGGMSRLVSLCLGGDL